MPNVLRLPIHSFDATYFHRIFPQKKDNGIRVQGVAAGQQIMMVQAPQQAQGQQGLLGGQPQVKLITPQVRAA